MSDTDSITGNDIVSLTNLMFKTRRHKDKAHNDFIMLETLLSRVTYNMIVMDNTDTTVSHKIRESHEDILSSIGYQLLRKHLEL